MKLDHNKTFSKASECYYYGDCLSGDRMLSLCLLALSNLAEESPEDESAIVEFIKTIRTQRNSENYVGLADSLTRVRHQFFDI
jgi:hypothetical protein